MTSETKPSFRSYDRTRNEPTPKSQSPRASESRITSSSDYSQRKKKSEKKNERHGKGSREGRARSGQAPLPTGQIKNTRNREEPIILKAQGIPRIRAEAPEKRAAPKRPQHATAPNENSNPPEEDEEEEDGEAGGERGGALLPAPSSRSAGGEREGETGEGRPAEGRRVEEAPAEATAVVGLSGASWSPEYFSTACGVA